MMIRIFTKREWRWREILSRIELSVCEERGTKEHDILIEFNDYILIVEAKASKVREPFFNPEKGYKRIRDHFHLDSGIGGAYEQAIILKKFIEDKDDAILYENKNKKFRSNEKLNSGSS